MGKRTPPTIVTLDVLTDGSEFAGSGTLFLSVWKVSKAQLDLLGRTRPSSDDDSNSEDESDSESSEESESGSDGSCDHGSEQSSNDCSDRSNDSNDSNNDDSNANMTQGDQALANQPAAQTQSDEDLQTKIRQTLFEVFDLSPPLARYAISGLGDGTARLCADQRFKLSATRSIFLPHASGACWDGLSALLFALHNAGAPSLHLVSPPIPRVRNGNSRPTDKVEALSSSILSKHKHLDIRTCEVPASNESQMKSWWQVYDDEFILVHARAVTKDSVAYIFSVVDHTTPGSNSNTHAEEATTTKTIPTTTPTTTPSYVNILTVPPEWDGNSQELAQILNGPLPTVGTATSKLRIDYVIQSRPAQHANDSTHIRTNEQSHDSPTIITTSPQNQSVDPAQLIQSQSLLRACHKAVPTMFPSTTFEDTSDDHASMSADVRSDRVASRPHQQLLLSSCTSMVLKMRNHEEVFVDRAQEIRQRRTNERKHLERFATSFKSLNDFQQRIDQDGAAQRRSPTVAIKDDDEIDLDDDDEGQDEDAGTGAGENEASKSNDENTKTPPEAAQYLDRVLNEPHLVVLGTGCASPSAIRGASGHAVVFPGQRTASGSMRDEVLLLDCGEAVTTMLLRYVKHVDWKTCIKGIWISHAHLDHFGGLPTLLRVLMNESASRQSSADGGATDPRDPDERNPQNTKWQQPSKMRRVEAEPLWVMAPAKVLAYVDAMLHLDRGFDSKKNKRWFVPLMHFCQPPRSRWTWFQNVKVNHSCCHPYGLIVGWDAINSTGQRECRFLCFSGDTRPCHQLVDACRRALASTASRLPLAQSSMSPAATQSTTRHDLNRMTLLHEATFNRDDADQAIQKKHATVDEAIRVGLDIPTTRILLTHFSHRYVSQDPESLFYNQEFIRQQLAERNLGCHTAAVGLAVDGMIVKL